MPGITGIICKNRTENYEEKLNLMVFCLLHEDFYSHGKYINRELGFFIGYTSLKDSFSDCMPIMNETGDLILFLTGECYFDQSDIEKVKKQIL